jgi:CheY-specific phosphatase CheX
MKREVNPEIPELMLTEQDLLRFLDRLLHRSRVFLEEEGKTRVLGVYPTGRTLDRIDLRAITAILTVEDRLRLIVAFSFEHSLLESVFQGCAGGIPMKTDEVELLMEETAGDCLNIVVGNALEEFQLSGYAFTVSTPIIIKEGKSIQRYRQSKFAAGEIHTDAGNMVVLCINPGIYYKRTLDLEVAE